jgi:hypothetical protein
MKEKCFQAKGKPDSNPNQLLKIPEVGPNPKLLMKKEKHQKIFP